MPPSFSSSALARLRDARVVEIETSAGDSRPAHRTKIWLVVDERDRVLVRSWRGAGARWYREAVARPDVALLLAGERLEARAVRATDADRVAACSHGFLAKYAGDPSAQAMVAEGILDTTLELLPR